MKTIRLFTLCLCISVLFVLVAVPLSSASFRLPDDKDAAPQPVKASEPADSAHALDDALFPDLEFSALASVSLDTPECSFDFQLNDEQDVSVNGHRADKDVFSTLISHIESLPLDTSSAPLSADIPMLTLVISTEDGQHHTAHFYDDAHSDVAVHVRTGPENAPVWRKTDAWRVGTLMMVCEGTRIQDERGNETPI